MSLLNDLKQLIISAISGDSSIKTYCITTFQTEPTILDGIDVNVPPIKETVCPCVSITFGRRYREANTHYLSHEMIVGVCIYDKNQTTILPVVSYDGAEKLEGLAALVEALVTKTLNANGYPNKQAPDFEDQTPGQIYPFFSCAYSYQIRIQSPL